MVRLTVLQAAYPTNAANLQAKIGGLLNRCVVPMLCRRDLDVNERRAAVLLRTCEVAARERSVVVVSPEYRLSLENKAVDLARRSGCCAEGEKPSILFWVDFFS